MSNSDIFLDTLKESKTTFFDETRLLRNYTKVYTQQELNDISIEGQTQQPLLQQLKQSSISEAHDSIEDTVAIVNFTLGTLFDKIPEYDVTSEMLLLMTSNLYQSLSSEYVKKEFYKYNSETKKNREDRIVYSKNVVLFRDDEFTVLDRPIQCDIITVSAPSRFWKKERVLNICKNILKVAVDNNIQELIIDLTSFDTFGIKWKTMGDCFIKAVKSFNHLPIKVINFTFSDDSLKLNYSKVICGYPIRKQGFFESLTK